MCLADSLVFFVRDTFAMLSLSFDLPVALILRLCNKLVTLRVNCSNYNKFIRSIKGPSNKMSHNKC